MVYSQVKTRLSYLEQQGRPHPEGGEMCASDFFIHGLLTCCGFGWVLQVSPPPLPPPSTRKSFNPSFFLPFRSARVDPFATATASPGTAAQTAWPRGAARRATSRKRAWKSSSRSAHSPDTSPRPRCWTFHPPTHRFSAGGNGAVSLRFLGRI